jgi:NhaP-type Na+/H+ or K+/H+ antiporter
MSASSFIQIQVSIILGVMLGCVVGIILVWFFKKWHMRDSVKVLIIISISFLLLEVQNRSEGVVPVSGLLAIMSMGIIINQKYDVLAKRLSVKYNKMWLGAEVFLFVLVGIAVDIKYALKAGIIVIGLVVLALVFRMIGVGLSLVKTDLTKKERLFCAIAYTPKATVQAAIGTIPLAMGLACGEMVLTVAVVAILITAPFGALCVDSLYKKLLEKE